MGSVPDDSTAGVDHDAAVARSEPDRSVSELIQAGRDREAARRGAQDTAHPDDPDGGTMDPLAQLDQLAPLLGGVVGGIRPDQLGQPTPCTELSVRGVLEHMIEGATAFAAAYRGEEPTEPDTSDPLASFGPVLGALGEAVSAPGALDQTVAAPFGEVPGETFARFIVLDGLVHGWDLATATGQGYDPPAELVAAVDEFAHQVVNHDVGEAAQKVVDLMRPRKGRR
jgi:uncharacterized protein (TIGR03086 family)